jgi:hypothetical protein
MLLRMHRTFCVMRKLTDDSRRGAGRATLKRAWTKEHDRGGEISQDKHRSSAVARFMPYGDGIGTLRPRAERPPIHECPRHL